jgi:hypothetical protein
VCEVLLLTLALTIKTFSWFNKDTAIRLKLMFFVKLYGSLFDKLDWDT